MQNQEFFALHCWRFPRAAAFWTGSRAELQADLSRPWGRVLSKNVSLPSGPGSVPAFRTERGVAGFKSERWQKREELEEETGWLLMMPLISGGIMSEPADISGRKSSTEGQTSALKPKHTPITTALIDDFSGGPSRCHPHCASQVLSQAAKIPHSCQLPSAPLNCWSLPRWRDMSDSGWWTVFPIAKRLFHHVMETLPRTVWLSSEQKHAKTLKTMEKTHRGKTGEKCDGTWS